MSLLSRISATRFRYKAARVLLQRPHSSHYLPFDSIKTMLLLSECETEADLHDIVYAIDLLTQAGKTVDAYCYCFKPSTDAPPHSAVRLLNRQDTDLTMRPKVAILKPFSRKHYDAVIDLTAGLCLPLRYLSLYANTSLRCGKDWGNFRIDIQNRQASPDNASEPLSDRRYLLQQIIHYLQQFK